MKLLLRPRSRHLLNQAKIAFLSVSQHRNVSPRPATKWVHELIGFRKAEGFRCFTSSGNEGATRHHENEAGSTESSLMKSMANKIKDQLSAESVFVKDANGDGRHVSIYVVSSTFEGQSAVNRQRMVYKAIWEELQATVHAVDFMVTRTPVEAGLDN